MRTLTLFVASCMTLAAAKAADLPFRVVTSSSEVLSLYGANVVATPLDQTDFVSGALATAQKLTSGTGTKTMRGDKTTPASVYRAVWSAGTDPNQHPYPPVVGSDLVYYEVNHEAVQSWATMNETGTPFVMVYADGQAHGTANASWSTRYVVQGTGTRDVYVQFTIPAVTFDDRWEDAAPATSWARMRMNFLVDAYPAWSTEALRFNEIYWNDEVHGYRQKAMRVDTFGYGLGLDSTHKSSASQRITVKLGTYNAGKALDLVMLFQVEAKLDSPCDEDGTEIVCGGASVKVVWDTAAAQPTFYSKPAT